MFALLSILPACFLLSDEPVACTDLAASSVTVEVADDSGSSVPGATATWTLDGAEMGACEEWYEGSFVCGWEQPGHIVVTVSAEGYEVATAEADVGMDASGCHVEGQVIGVTLSETVCTADIQPSVLVTMAGSEGESLENPEVWWNLAGADMADQPCDGDGETWTCGEDVAGDLEIIGVADGHATRVVPVTVAMAADGCHVVTEEVELLLDSAE